MPLLSVLRSLCRTFPVQKNVSRLRVNNSCLSPIAQSIQRTCVTSSDSKRLLCYERKADETLESLCDQTDEILCSSDALKDYDVNLSVSFRLLLHFILLITFILQNGVLTIDLSHRGTYVINKQSVNQQIWLSSPVR